MKARTSSSNGDRAAPVKPDSQQGWEQQVDYPVPDSSPAGGNEGDQGAQAAREERIRARAYERAKQRGFAGGDEVVDWLEAEREVSEEERGQVDGGERR